MTAFAFWAIFAAGAIFTYRKVWVAIYEYFAPDFDGFDRFMTTFVSLFAAALWPIGLAGYLIYRTLTPTPPSVLAARVREREQEADRREREIRRLESELGIGGQR